jgi:maltooligosyltrehalose trehalohydrolase
LFFIANLRQRISCNRFDSRCVTVYPSNVMKIGANYLGNGRCLFTVWAPMRGEVAVRLVKDGGRIVEMEKDERGYWRSLCEGVYPGTCYSYILEGSLDRPDPASRFQPEGVHGPSCVVDPLEFSWTEGRWEGKDLKDFVIYELHVGAFTEPGTFEAIIPHLDYLTTLGITAVELMPVGQFPGGRNWGYDGVYPYAPQNSYGGPTGLKRLINECHRKGLAVILDVVYNHLGPEGNYLNDFGPYFTDRYKTPWGDAVNFDGPYSDEVRNYFIENALYWTLEYHFDALRIDAIHGIFDFSANHFLRVLAASLHREAEAAGRRIYAIAESDLNDVRVINPVEIGGYGLDAQWNDDFHHAVHTLLTDEDKGYYEDFGRIGDMAKAFREGFIYSGQYSGHRKRSHGSSSKDRPASQFIVFSQNHDQVGNRMLGDRPGHVQTFEKLKLAAGVVILSPYIPLLFMGEEYGETAPFPYFVSHSDEALIEAVRTGREREFESFRWEGEIPDPQAEETFLNSKIDITRHLQGEHRTLFDFYRNLLKLRKDIPALCNLGRDNMAVACFEGEKVIFLRRWFGADEIFCLFNFGAGKAAVACPVPPGTWQKILDSSSRETGPAPVRIESGLSGGKVRLAVNPHSFVLYVLPGEKG